jgi:hypothetical protein
MRGRASAAAGGGAADPDVAVRVVVGGGRREQERALPGGHSGVLDRAAAFAGRWGERVVVSRRGRKCGRERKRKRRRVRAGLRDAFVACVWPDRI